MFNKTEIRKLRDIQMELACFSLRNASSVIRMSTIFPTSGFHRSGSCGLGVHFFDLKMQFLISKMYFSLKITRDNGIFNF